MRVKKFGAIALLMGVALAALGLAGAAEYASRALAAGQAQTDCEQSVQALARSARVCERLVVLDPAGVPRGHGLIIGHEESTPLLQFGAESQGLLDAAAIARLCEDPDVHVVKVEPSPRCLEEHDKFLKASRGGV